jgi:retinol dehydrogenase-12
MNPSKIILGCRNMTTAAEAVEAIKADGFDNIEAWHLDQGSFASVKAFTKKYNDSGLDLHVLLANAGMLPFKSSQTPDISADGHEIM